MNGTIIVREPILYGAVRQANEKKKQVIFKKHTPFSDCISKINNIQVHNANDLHVAMSIIQKQLFNYNYNVYL